MFRVDSGSIRQRVGWNVTQPILKFNALVLKGVFKQSLNNEIKNDLMDIEWLITFFFLNISSIILKL